MTPHRDAGSERDAVSPLADPGTRLAAVTLDALVPLAPQILAVVIGIASSSGATVAASSWVSGASWVVALGIDLWLLHRYGQTIGKRIMGLRIVRASGARATLARLLFARTVAPALLGLVPIAGSLFWLVDSLMIFGRERRTIHDLLADTIVVDLRAPVPKPAGEEVFR